MLVVPALRSLFQGSNASSLTEPVTSEVSVNVRLRPEQGTARLDLEDGEELREPRAPPPAITRRDGSCL